MAYLYTRYLRRRAGDCPGCRRKEKEANQETFASARREEEPMTDWEQTESKKDFVRDQEYFRGLYPLRIRRMKDYVREELEGMTQPSFFTDEYPDRVRMDRARDRIFQKMQQDSVEEVLLHGEYSRDVVETLLYQEILEQRSRR